MASIAGEYDVVLVARSDGLMNADIRPLVRLSVQVIVESNGSVSRVHLAEAGVLTMPILRTKYYTITRQGSTSGSN